MHHTVSTISSKGQVTLPSELRKALRMQPGERIAWEIEDGKLVGKRVRSLMELAGIFKGMGTSDEPPPKSEWAKAAIAKHIRRSKQK